MAARCRFEASQRQIKIGRKNVEGAVKVSSLIVDISHHAVVNAGNAVEMKHRWLIDFNALSGSALNHQNTSKDLIKNLLGDNPAENNAHRAVLKGRPANLLKLYGAT